ncbi:MAG: hemolysin III family protein [Lachnospiraceae bacterium]|jgi:hemolysin III|nr:hemolysin III family protein [Lachnospiraceae bacterium]
MKLKVKDPGSALTHLIAMVLTILASAPLLIRAAASPGRLHITAIAVFIVSMTLLYAASTVYHTFDVSERVNKLLKKLDHMMIFVLIAGTYTPVCLIVLGNPAGYRLLALVWGIAAMGILINALWITCPKWFSSCFYIAMGWVCITAFRQILSALTPAAFAWLLAGGVIYTIGGVIYALKLPIFNAKHKSFGSHEIFHLFVMGGSFCHYVMMYGYVAVS